MYFLTNVRYIEWIRIARAKHCPNVPRHSHLRPQLSKNSINSFCISRGLSGSSKSSTLFETHDLCHMLVPCAVTNLAFLPLHQSSNVPISTHR